MVHARLSLLSIISLLSSSALYSAADGEQSHSLLRSNFADEVHNAGSDNEQMVHDEGRKTIGVDEPIVNQDDVIQISSVGDWGQSDVVTSGVAKWSTQKAKDGVLLLGDNFYPAGVSSAYDPQFSLFENGLQGQDPNRDKTNYYVIVGNHDYYGNVKAQLEYAKINPHWVLPSFYYSHTFVSKSSKVKVHMIATDTWTLNGGDAIFKRWRMKDGPDLNQYAWIEKELTSEAAKSADWVIVIGHFPLNSCVRYEHAGVKDMKERLEPLLKKYKVDAYLYGHDHILQHLEVDGVHHFGSGAGGKKFYFVDKGYSGLKSVIAGYYGYMEHEFTKSTFKTTTYYSKHGEKVLAEEYVIHKSTQNQS